MKSTCQTVSALPESDVFVCGIGGEMCLLCVWCVVCCVCVCVVFCVCVVCGFLCVCVCVCVWCGVLCVRQLKEYISSKYHRIETTEMRVNSFAGDRNVDSANRYTLREQTCFQMNAEMKSTARKLN